MSTQWKNIDEIKSTQELNQILSGLDEREQFNFKIEVLAYAHNNAHSRFILWSKLKLNRYKYRKYAIKTDFIKWCKNICYFIRFYAIVMMVSEGHYNEQNNGGLI